MDKKQAVKKQQHISGKAVCSSAAMTPAEQAQQDDGSGVKNKFNGPLPV
jgi:hypothetical protein